MRNRRSLLQSVWNTEQQATALNSMKTGDREGKMNTQKKDCGSFTCVTYYE